ncbi:hypothetical protein [Reichenbachiella versicolor]|uniref:hypothetical protein n=1 Tax=Reichenbachiella versicolor TaxID=1821036 RepID=UPI000D6E688A|nr:hypothetical protein [Reichenbachiella versicolor]
MRWIIGIEELIGIGIISHVLDDVQDKMEDKVYLFRNVSEAELSSFIRKGYNFGIGGDSMFGQKQFWRDVNALQKWMSDGTFKEPYVISILVSERIIGPYGLAQYRELDGNIAVTVDPHNLNAFNKAKTTVGYGPNPVY